MKKTAWYCGALVLAVLNAVYLALTADSFYLEYVKDEFVYWGYPQWGWMYSDPKIYLWFNVLYLAFLLLLFAAGLFLIGKKRLKTGTALLLLPLLTAAAFLYMPTYNWNRQFAVFNAERTNENSRIPEGKWWVSLDQMQRYYDASLWERLKGRFGRGEWPGGCGATTGFGCCPIFRPIRSDAGEWFFTAEPKTVRRGELTWVMILLILPFSCGKTKGRWTLRSVTAIRLPPGRPEKKAKTGKVRQSSF